LLVGDRVDSLSLSISDDGIGGAESGKGSGLIGLKDREVLGGRMQVDSPPGSGTKLDITIPHERYGGKFRLVGTVSATR
jgi:signal transduction histidine kinase